MASYGARLSTATELYFFSHLVSISSNKPRTNHLESHKSTQSSCILCTEKLELGIIQIKQSPVMLNHISGLLGQRERCSSYQGRHTYRALQEWSCLSFPPHSFSSSILVQLKRLNYYSGWQARDPPASARHVLGLQTSITIPSKQQRRFPLHSPEN